MDLKLAARDGVMLAATFFEPPSAPRGAVLINSGTGIPRKFYGSFAAWLASQGFAVLTYDYRGIGESDARHDAAMEAWGRIDQASMLDHLATLAPGAPRAIVGHSFGGQVLGLADNIGDVSAAVLVCSQSGHWRHWPGPRRKLRMFALWWLYIPILTALTGRFPGSWVGTADLPKGIARSWARWGRSPHYVCDARGQPLRPYNDRVVFPIRWLSFSDDPAAPEEAVAALLPYYPKATIERCAYTPAELGVPVVGHFGFFRKWMPRTAWQPVADWLGERLQAARRPGQTVASLEGSASCPHPTFSPRSRMASAG